MCDIAPLAATRRKSIKMLKLTADLYKALVCMKAVNRCTFSSRAVDNLAITAVQLSETITWHQVINSSHIRTQKASETNTENIYRSILNDNQRVEQQSFVHKLLHKNPRFTVCFGNVKSRSVLANKDKSVS